jgi:hypothetical protein
MEMDLRGAETTMKLKRVCSELKMQYSSNLAVNLKVILSESLRRTADRLTQIASPVSLNASTLSHQQTIHRNFNRYDVEIDLYVETLKGNRVDVHVPLQMAISASGKSTVAVQSGGTQNTQIVFMSSGDPYHEVDTLVGQLNERISAHRRLSEADLLILGPLVAKLLEESGRHHRNKPLATALRALKNSFDWVLHNRGKFPLREEADAAQVEQEQHFNDVVSEIDKARIKEPGSSAVAQKSQPQEEDDQRYFEFMREQQANPSPLVLFPEIGSEEHEWSERMVERGRLIRHGHGGFTLKAGR